MYLSCLNLPACMGTDTGDGVGFYVVGFERVGAVGGGAPAHESIAFHKAVGDQVLVLQLYFGLFD